MKKISNAKSHLSKKKMDSFIGDMTKYGKLLLSSKDRMNLIDDLFYINFKLEMLKDRTQTITEKTMRKFNRNKIKSRFDNKVNCFTSEKKISPGLVLN